MVDLSKAKAGDTVKFRCGGQAKIRLVEGTAVDKWLDVWLVGYGSELTFNIDGELAGPKGSTPLDITEIIPAPVEFDWKDAKRGMAFKHGGGLVHWLIGPDLEMTPVFQTGRKKDTRICYVQLSGLTRAPKHDITENN